MHQLARQAFSYLHALGLPATPPHSLDLKNLPYYLSDAFALAACELAGEALVLVIEREVGRSPAEVARLVGRLGEAIASATPVYVTAAMTSYDRKRLIEHRVPFLVPGNQLFLPDLGMALREHFRRPKAPAQSLSPSAQALLISALRRAEWGSEFSVAEVARALGYTPMTASRAARELAAVGVAEVKAVARKRMLSFKQEPRATWETALPFLRSPVQRVEHVRFVSDIHRHLRAFRLAGLPALAEYSMLAAESERVYATGREGWAASKQQFGILPRSEPGITAEVQIWSYPVALEPGSDLVDPLSLYLSMRESDDPRIESALQELMEKAWQ